MYHKNTLIYDIAFLINAYNIVGSISSLIIGSLKLNNNLKIFFEYYFYRMIEKIYHLHYDLYNLQRNYTIIRIKCKDFFTIINP